MLGYQWYIDVGCQRFLAFFFYAKEYRLLDLPPVVMSNSRRFIP